jgi:hypothetical protein
MRPEKDGERIAADRMSKGMSKSMNVSPDQASVPILNDSVGRTRTAEQRSAKRWGGVRSFEVCPRQRVLVVWYVCISVDCSRLRFLWVFALSVPLATIACGLRFHHLPQRQEARSIHKTPTHILPNPMDHACND